MNMKIASLFLAAGILAETTTAQASSHQNRLRALSGEQENFPPEYQSLSMPAALMEIEGSSAKLSPSTNKASKSGKGSKASCETDDFLEERFGPQLCPSEIEKKFTKSENTVMVSEGLLNFKSPGFSVPIVDTFNTISRIDMTWDQTQTVCLTMCDNNPNCGTVAFQGFRSLPGSKPNYRCVMLNPELGPGAYLAAEPSGYRAPLEDSVTYRKTLSTPLPPFEACNVSPHDIGLAVECYFDNSDPACEGLLTEDWKTYVAPAVGCLAMEGGPELLGICLECLENTTVTTVNQICLTDPKFSVIRGDCGEECSSVCENELQQTLLCIAGSPLERRDDMSYGGFPNRPNNYTCPIE